MAEIIIKEEEKILIEVLGEVVDRIKAKTDLLTIEENKVKIRPKITIEEIAVKIKMRAKLIIENLIAQIETIKEAIKKIKVHTNKELNKKEKDTTDNLVEIQIENIKIITILIIQITSLDNQMRKEEKEMLRIEMSLKISYLYRFLQERRLNK